MENKSKQSPLRYKKDQIGCMWGLINIFDFRHGGSSAQRLIADRRRRSGHAVSTETSASKVKMLSDYNEGRAIHVSVHNETNPEETGANKPSVKKLIDEEMFIGPEPKQQISRVEVEEKKSQLEHGSDTRKNRKRTSRTRKKTNNMNVPENHNIDIKSITDELYSLILQKSISCPEDLGLEEKLSEATKLFGTKKLLTWDHKFKNSEESMNALQTLVSNKDLFMELVKDPNSLLAKHVQTLQDSIKEKGEKSNSKGKIYSTRKIDVFASRKKLKSLKRKMKFSPRKLKENESSEAPNQIVILKPVKAGLGDRRVSHFSFAEIKRRLKQAMGKERSEISLDSISHRVPYLKPNISYKKKRLDVKNVERKSPRRNSFYGKKFPKLPVDEKSVLGENETEFFLVKEVSNNIYIEAKKHLSEMLTSGNEDEACSSSRQVPETLGRILSLPEYNFSPLCSPIKDCEHKFVTARMRFSGHDDEMGKLVCSLRNDTSSEGDMKVIRTSDKGNLDSENSRFSITENGNTSEICDARGYPECVSLDILEDAQTLSSSSVSSSSSPFASKVEYAENENDGIDRPSPISVLETLFTDDDTSPSSTISLPSKPLITPLQIRFEEEDSSSGKDEDSHLNTYTEALESIFEYCETILQAPGICREQLYMKSLSSNQLLDPTLFDEVVFFSNHLCHDQKLLFDCINEILVQVCRQYFCCSHLISPVKPTENLIYEVCEGIEWVLTPLVSPQTLEQIVRKDLAKIGKWVDLRYDIEEIGANTSETIFDELMEDAILSCLDIL